MYHNIKRENLMYSIFLNKLLHNLRVYKSSFYLTFLNLSTFSIIIDWIVFLFSDIINLKQLTICWKTTLKITKRFILNKVLI